MLEITIYSRGGQGGVTAARIIAATAMLHGYYAQAMPQFGPERRGAEVKAFVRISERPIRRRSPIKNPNIAVLFDSKFELVEEPQVIVINTTGRVQNGCKICQLDATEIAIRNGLVNAGWPILSPAMSGALARVLGFDLDLLREAIMLELGSRAEKSVIAAEEAYRVVECSSNR